MKHLYLIFIITLISVAAKAQSYYIATAKKSGNWSDEKKWDYVTRQDGKMLTSIVIPKNVTITLNEDEDLKGLGDVEMEIAGTLEIRSDKSLYLNTNSLINIIPGGIITLHANAINQDNEKKIEQIWIGNEIKFDGNKQVSISGPATASISTGVAPQGFVSNAMLPVTFVAFTASKHSDDVIALSWTTTDEVNNSHFEVQRSIDGINFKSVAIVLPGDNNSNLNIYQYSDRYASKGVLYYRIRQVDRDGKDKFSPIKVIGSGKEVNMPMIYVAASKRVIIDLKDASNGVMIRLISLSGAVIKQQTGVAAGQKVVLEANSAPTGVYVVQVSDSKGLMTSKKVFL